tara:strand:- start:980 stop:2167 length:1188 start_codon:yes stop_codon:yes gene_type:complete
VLNSIQKNKWLVSILLLALLLRLMLLALYPDQNFPDARAYRTMGYQIFNGEVISNNIYMPLYPIITYIAGSITTQLLIDIFMSTVMVLVIYMLSMTLFNNKIGALFAAFSAALYPHFIFYSLSGLTETSFTLLMLVSFLFFYREKTFLAIFFLVLSVLIRPSLDLINPVLVLIFSVYIYKLGYIQSIKKVLIYFIIYIFMMSPWWMYQYDKYGQFVRLTLADGIILYSGNNPMNTTGGGVGNRNGISDVDLTKFNKILNPIERNDQMKKKAIEYIMANPVHFVEMSAVKFIRFWRLWPYTEHYQQWYIFASSLLSYGVMLALSIGFLVRNTKNHFKKLLPIFVLIAYLTLVHMATIGSIRYRFPLEPFLIIFASQFLFDLIRNNLLYKKIEKIFL